jgi:uncharacterized protein (DUF433 family)
MIDIKNFINIEPEILGGQPVFKGTRVPVDTLFDHLENGISINEFLDDFPSVTREQVIAVIEIAAKLISSKDLQKFYETAA